MRARVSPALNAGLQSGYGPGCAMYSSPMLAKLITRTSLERLAGATSFRRGEEYFAAGAVGRLRVTDDLIKARVEGTETYRVELRDERGALAYDCTCPHAADGNFCKHCVAVGLAWLAEPASEATTARSGRKKRRDPWQDIRAYLAAQPPAAMVDLLLEIAERDDALYRSLLLKAERHGGGDAASAFRRAIDEATHSRRFIGWREAGAFARGIDEVVASMAELLVPATAATLVELAEYAIERIENAMEEVDDSNGEVGDIVYRLGELHVKACTLARPEPSALAARLFRLETTQPFGLCAFDAGTYRKALGAAGLRRYRELAEAEWRNVKPRGSNDRYDVSVSRITRIMERLAEASGDVDALVAIKSRDLSSGYDYLAIAEIWAKAKQPDKALDWAERGLKASPDHPDGRLRDFLVAAYLKRGRHDEALQLTWGQFEERPCLEHYRKLHGVARKLGVWPEQRRRALARIEAVAERVATAPGRWKATRSAPDSTLRVEIALWENDLDAAWESVQDRDCSRGLLITLAGKLEASRAGDAVTLYRRVVPSIVEQSGNAAYEEAIKLVRKVGAIMKAQSLSREYGEYLGELRARFKPKRNFIKLLDAVRHAQARSPG